MTRSHAERRTYTSASIATKGCSFSRLVGGFEVLPMVLTLTDETLPLLSRGWGAGIGMSFVGWWIAATGFFCLFLETESSTSLAALIVAVATPLGMVSNVAVASSECDLLSDTLTEKRKRGPPDDLLYEHAVSRIEKILDRQNTKQGVGFVMFERVVDTKSCQHHRHARIRRHDHPSSLLLAPPRR